MADFATLEARVTTVALSKLNNAAVVLDGVTVDAVFDSEYAPIERGMGFSANMPAVKVATSSVPANPVGKEVIVNGTTYEVVEHQPDGTGMSMLLLELVP